jgi:glycosyltransferase involved in cell wall biosynthesis
MSDAAGVSVIIPTACRRERTAALQQAVASVLMQEGVDVEIIVVVNGPDYNHDLFAWLTENPRLRVEYRPEPSLPAAHRVGRSLVTKPFFSFLDDDDEYLPGALLIRLDAMLEDPTVDVIATNGVWGGGSEEPYIRHTDGVEEDPLGALLRGNWLGSGGALFRSATVGLDNFDGRTRFFEWTMIAWRVATAGLKVRFIDVPTYRMNATPNSLSRSEAYYLAEPGFLQSLLEAEISGEHRRRIRDKILAANHFIADWYVRSGNAPRAWRYHLRSVRGAAGLRHLVFTPKLLRATAASALKRLAGGFNQRGLPR